MITAILETGVIKKNEHMRIEKLAALLLAGSGILLSSCNERIETDTPTTSTDWGNELRAELTGVGDVQTRSHNVNIYEVRWDAGDQIYVKDANGQHAKFTLVNGENTTSGVFRQNNDEAATLSGAIEAFSPAEIGEIREWPSVMTDNAETPMYSAKDARSEGDESLKFKSLGSVVNLVFNSQTQGATLQSITLSANQPLSGAFTVDADGKAVLADDANGAVTLDLGVDGKALISPAAYSFYLYVPSGDYTNLTATFNAIGRKPYVCDFGTKTLHHNAVEKFSVAGRLSDYTVTFDTRGYAAEGTEPADQHVLYGDLVSKPADPASNDETIFFKGWYKDEARTEAYDFDNDKVTEDIILYARWQKKERYGEMIKDEEFPLMLQEESTFINRNLKIVVGRGSSIMNPGLEYGVTVEALTGGINFSLVADDGGYTYIDHIQIYAAEVHRSGYRDNPHWKFIEKFAIWENPDGAESVDYYGDVYFLYSIRVGGYKITEL